MDQTRTVTTTVHGELPAVLLSSTPVVWQEELLVGVIMGLSIEPVRTPSREIRGASLSQKMFQVLVQLITIRNDLYLPGSFPWMAGAKVHVSWSITANHGGGYQYRLCPANQNLTEECFQKMPLDFVGQQGFVWADGTDFWFNGTYVTEGTIPKGSKWAMNPLPRNDTANTGASFPPRCEEVPDCGSTEVNSKCKCSGMWGPYNLLIVDILQVGVIKVCLMNSTIKSSI